jgi:hypothetical protein
MNGLMVHATEKDGTKRARIVTLDEMRECVTPPSQGPRHKPVPHHRLVTTLLQSLDDNGFDIPKAEYAVGMRRKGPDGIVYPDTTVFGVLEVQARAGRSGNPDTDEYTRAIGFRSNNVQQYSIQIRGGASVFVCDNLILSGADALCNKMHTTRLDLEYELDRAISGVVRQGAQLDEQVRAMAAHALPAKTAQALLFAMFAKKVLPLRLLPEVNRNYFEPEDTWTDCAPRTLWGIHNASTRALRELPMNRRQDCTTDLTKFLTSRFSLN